MFSKKKPDSLFSFIAEGMQVTGNIQCAGELQVDGQVDGTIQAARLVVGEGGKINGEINASTVLIKGMVEGTINAEQVTIEKSAKVRGDVIHDTLSMEAGAIVEGSLTHKHQVASVTPLKEKSQEA
ncbi:polymer-forming cytoskeletal protein [Pseudoalteromonas fenneropenaei]|uniref:Polymer-forming cytoskeletal protein n=1 Tax=Pseudoalteromonas fenneropenaei TaxID=1737459 RepID=A0ABV7CL48_9GAMM